MDPVQQFTTDFSGYFHWIIRKSSRSLHVDPKTKKDLYRTFLRLAYLFKTCLNDVDDIIIGGGIVVRPLQFPIGQLPSMTSIIEKQGSGWDNINEKTFFNQSEGNQRQDVVMSTSKEFEEWETQFDESNQLPQQSCAVLYLAARMGIVNPSIKRQI